MNAKLNKIISLDREEMTDTDRQLFLSDFKRLCDEYFESFDYPSLEITRTENGFLVCLFLSASRIKSVKKPQ